MRVSVTPSGFSLMSLPCLSGIWRDFVEWQSLLPTVCTILLSCFFTVIDCSVAAARMIVTWWQCYARKPVENSDEQLRDDYVMRGRAQLIFVPICRGPRRREGFSADLNVSNYIVHDMSWTIREQTKLGEGRELTGNNKKLDNVRKEVRINSRFWLVSECSPAYDSGTWCL